MSLELASIRSLWACFKDPLTKNAIIAAIQQTTSHLVDAIDAIDDPKKTIEEEMDRKHGALNRSMLHMKVKQLLPLLRNKLDSDQVQGNTQNVALYLFYTLLDNAWTRYSELVSSVVTGSGAHWARLSEDEERGRNGTNRYLDRVTITNAYAMKLWSVQMDVTIKKDYYNMRQMMLFQWYNESAIDKEYPERYVVRLTDYQQVQRDEATIKLIRVESDAKRLQHAYTSVLNELEIKLSTLIDEEKTDLKLDTFHPEDIAIVQTSQQDIHHIITICKQIETSLVRESLARDISIPPQPGWEQTLKDHWKQMSDASLLYINQIQKKYNTTTNQSLRDDYMSGYRSRLELKFPPEMDNDDEKDEDEDDTTVIANYTSTLLSLNYHSKRVKELTSIVRELNDVGRVINIPLFKQYPVIVNFQTEFLTPLITCINTALNSHEGAVLSRSAYFNEMYRHKRDRLYALAIRKDKDAALQRLIGFNDPAQLREHLQNNPIPIEAQNGKCTLLAKTETSYHLDDGDYKNADLLVQGSEGGEHDRIIEQVKTIVPSLEHLRVAAMDYILKTQRIRLASSTRRHDLDTELTRYLDSAARIGGSSHLDILPVVNPDDRRDFVETFQRNSIIRLAMRKQEGTALVTILRRYITQADDLHNPSSLADTWEVLVSCWLLIVHSLVTIS